jgi:hypothetical protein
LNNKQNPKKEFFRKTQIEFVLKAYKPTLMEKTKQLYEENDENWGKKNNFFNIKKNNE